VCQGWVSSQVAGPQGISPNQLWQVLGQGTFSFDLPEEEVETEPEMDYEEWDGPLYC